MTADRTCDVCGAPTTLFLGWVSSCGRCGFLASALTPGAGTGVDGIEELRRLNFERLLDRLDAVHPLVGTHLLEVGSARGWFLEAVRRRGATVTGIEPELANAEFARSLGFDVVSGFFPDDLPDRGPFDVIVFNDVFEHLPRPGTMLATVAALLAPGGTVAINIPSSDGVLFRIASLMARAGADRLYARLWQKGFASPHVSYFSPRNLELLARRHTPLRLVESFPLPAVARHGLRARIAASHRGARGLVLFAGRWLFSFVSRALPSDIEVLIFERPPLANEAATHLPSAAGAHA